MACPSWDWIEASLNACLRSKRMRNRAHAPHSRHTPSNRTTRSSGSTFGANERRVPCLMRAPYSRHSSRGEPREDRHRGELRLAELLPADALRLRERAPRPDDPLRRRDQVEGDIVVRHRERPVEDLQLVDRRRDRGVLIHGAALPGPVELQAAVTAPPPPPPPLPPPRPTAP